MYAEENYAEMVDEATGSGRARSLHEDYRALREGKQDNRSQAVPWRLPRVRRFA